jgi:hypothetical protein
MSLLQSRRYASERFSPERGRLLHPSAALLPGVRLALHHVRARAAARADGAENQRREARVRPRENRTLDGDCAAQTPGGCDAVEMAINRIVQKLESEGEADIPTHRIGALVMAELKKLDAVAYIRYASVYRDFSDAADFEKFVDKLS